MITTQDKASLVRNFSRFRNLSAQDRLLHFDYHAKNMCSDEWREKFRKFLQTAGSSSDENLVNEIFAHSQIDVFDPKQVTGCGACREAFWKLVFMST